MTRPGKFYLKFTHNYAKLPEVTSGLRVVLDKIFLGQVSKVLKYFTKQIPNLL